MTCTTTYLPSSLTSPRASITPTSSKDGSTRSATSSLPMRRCCYDERPGGRNGSTRLRDGGIENRVAAQTQTPVTRQRLWTRRTPRTLRSRTRSLTSQMPTETRSSTCSLAPPRHSSKTTPTRAGTSTIREYRTNPPRERERNTKSASRRSPCLYWTQLPPRVLGSSDRGRQWRVRVTHALG